MKTIVLMVSLWSAQLLAQPNSISFSFTVPQGQQDTSTSAAVYDSTGTMVRWLWGNVTYPPGTYTKTWDGTLYGGTAATVGATYTIKLLENNVVYTYDGRLGSTEKSLNTTDHYATFSWQQGTQFLTFAFAGGRGWFSSGYAEGAINVGTFADVNKPQVINQNYQHGHIQLIDIATDGTWMYLLNQGVGTVDATWVTALDASSGMPVFFASGTLVTGSTLTGWPKQYSTNTVPSSWSNTTISTIDNGTWVSGSTNPTNIAVQRSGNILAVAHGASLIRLFDKRAGTSLGTITSIANPTWMAFNSEGLWVVSNGGLYLVSNVGGTNTVSQPITGFSNVVSVGTNGATNSIFVLDGGTHQQMFEYAVTTHALMRTYGDVGGYSNCDPTVSKTKLMLDTTYSTGGSTPYRAWVRVDDNDNVWLADTGTGYRILHISPSNQYVERLMYQRPSYQARISHTMPTRLLSFFWEYSVDYTKPLLPGDPDPALGGNGSWELVKNWNVCAGATTAGVTGAGAGAQAFEQLSNGNAYAAYSGTGVFTNIFQLPSSGPIRKVATVPASIRALMLRNGSLGYSTTTGTAPNQVITIYNAPITSFNGSSDPIWGAFAVVATATLNPSNSFLIPGAYGSIAAAGDVTSDGVYPVLAVAAYNSSGTTYQPHLGAVKSGFASYAWMALPEVCLTFPDYHGGYACTQSFGGHNGLTIFPIEGQNIFVTYDGQGATYGNQHYHFWSDGLMVGQFGQTHLWNGSSSVGVTPIQVGSYGYNYGDMASNLLSSSSTTVNGDIYFYHGDEAGFATFHRWHISNLASIHEFSGTGILQANGGAMLSQLF